MSDSETKLAIACVIGFVAIMLCASIVGIQREQTRQKEIELELARLKQSGRGSVESREEPKAILLQ